MISKILRIDNLGVFDGFQWDSTVLDEKSLPLTFKKINIFYGRNYSGKTTISRIMRSLETHKLPERYDNPSFTIQCDDGSVIDQTMLSRHNTVIRVFNEDFVRTNLGFLCDPDKGISSFAILGAENQRIETEIAAIAAVLGSNEQDAESGLYKERAIRQANLRCAQIAYASEQKDIEDKLSKKATDRTTGIKYNYEKFGDQNYTITKLKVDISSVLTPTYRPLDQMKIREIEQTIAERAIPPAPSQRMPSVKYDDVIVAATEVLARPIGASNKIHELLLDTALNNWVKTGVALHTERSRCEFCGSHLTDERRAELHAHFDEESRILEADIDVCIKKLETDMSTMKSSFSIDKSKFYTPAHEQLDSLYRRFVDLNQKFCMQSNALIDQLNTRKSKITIPFQLVIPNDIRNEIFDLFDIYDKLRTEQETYKEGLTRKQEQAKSALRLHEVANFCSAIDYSSVESRLSELGRAVENGKEHLEQLESVIKEKEESILSLRRQQNDEEEGARRVNEYLNNYFGHGFLSLQSISDGGDNPTIRFEIFRDNKKAYNLSEGECSLIAFCYFMAKLDDVETKGNKPIIWIDDPISSLDGNHVFFVYSLLRAEIIERQDFNQLFVSTHNLDFLKYMKRLTGKDRDPKMSFFVIQRSQNLSTLQRMPGYMKTYVTEFNYLFHEIYKCSKIQVVDDTNYVCFYNFGNNARKFLELLTFFYYPNHDSPVSKLEKFFGVDRVPALLTDRINNEYSHLCGVFERGEVPIEIPEMLTSAKLIISTLREKNPDQFAALMVSIGEDPEEQ